MQIVIGIYRKRLDPNLKLFFQKSSKMERHRKLQESERGDFN